MQKNMDPPRDDALAFSRVVIIVRSSYLHTSGGSAFWCLVGGLTFSVAPLLSLDHEVCFYCFV